MSLSRETALIYLNALQRSTYEADGIYLVFQVRYSFAQFGIPFTLMGSAPFIRPRQMKYFVLVGLGYGKKLVFDIGEGSSTKYLARLAPFLKRAGKDFFQ
jgi:hypothetical protein